MAEYVASFSLSGTGSLSLGISVPGTVTLTATSSLSAGQHKATQVAKGIDELSSIIVNQNTFPASDADAAVLGDTWLHQEFVLPADYARPNRVPDLTGLQIYVTIEEGRAACATVDFKIDYYDEGIGWQALVAGTAVGAASDSSRVSDPTTRTAGTWMELPFAPVDITDHYAKKFRFGIRGRDITEGVVKEPVEYDGTSFIFRNQQFTVVPDISPVPLKQGQVYQWEYEGVPSLLHYDNDGGIYYSEQHGVEHWWYSAPNPLDSQNCRAYGNDGVEALQDGGDISFLFRVLSATGESGRDFLGNNYRSAVITSDPNNIRSLDVKFEDTVWMSKPNPSKFAVECLYFDVRDKYGDAKTIDRVLLDPATPGMYFNVYWSNDPAPGTDEQTWDDLLWERVPQVFKAARRQTHPLPYPISAKYLKLEFTHLQAKYYAPGNFQKPVIYKKHPRWVVDYFLALYADQVDPTQYDVERVAVQYDAIELAYEYYRDDLRDSPLPPDYTDATSRIDILSNFLKREPTTANVADQRTLEQIRFKMRPFLDSPFSRGQSGFILKDYLDAEDVYATETISRARQQLVDVTAFDRDQIIVEKTEPVFYYHLTARHRYRVSSGLFERDRAYFAGVKEVAFTRELYSQRSDLPLYIDMFADGQNVERNDFAIPSPSIEFYTADVEFALTATFSIDIEGIVETAEPVDGIDWSEWEPLEGTGPAEILSDESGYGYLQGNYSETSVPAQADWSAQARPVDYYHTLVDSHPKLVARWRLNEPDGATTAVDTTGTYDGTYTGTRRGGYDPIDRYWETDSTASEFFATDTTFNLSYVEYSIGSVSSLNYSVGSVRSFIINAYDGSGNFLAASNVLTTAALSTSNFGFRLTWDSVPGATEYRIYRGTASSFQRLIDYVAAPTVTYDSPGDSPFIPTGYLAELPYSRGLDPDGRVEVGDVLDMTGTTTFSVRVSERSNLASHAARYGPEFFDEDADSSQAYNENDARWLIRKLETVEHTDGTTPSVAATSTYGSASSSTTHTVTIPSSTAVGDLLIVTVSSSHSPTLSGYNRIGGNLSITGGTRWHASYYKVATAADIAVVNGGTGTGTFNFTTSSSSALAATVLRVIDADTEFPIEGADSGLDVGGFVRENAVEAIYAAGARLIIATIGTRAFSAAGATYSLSGYTAASVPTSHLATNRFSVGALYRTFGPGSVVAATPTVTNGENTTDQLWTHFGIRPKRTFNINGWGLKDTTVPARYGGTSRSFPQTLRQSIDADGRTITMSFDGTTVRRYLGSSPSQITTSQSIGDTTAPLVIADQYTGQIADVQIYQPNLTPTEVDELQEAMSNIYNTPCAGFYPTSSLGQYEHVRVTMKYNIGATNVPNNFASIYSTADKTAVVVNNTIGVAVKVQEGDDPNTFKFVRGSVTHTDSGAEVSIQHNLVTVPYADSGAYFEGDAINADPYPAVSVPSFWTDGGIYWVTLEVQGNKFTFKNWTEDPAGVGASPDQTLVVNLTTEDSINVVGDGTLAGVGIAPIFGNPTTRLLDFQIEELDPPTPVVDPPLSGTKHVARYDFNTPTSIDNTGAATPSVIPFTVTAGAEVVDEVYFSFYLDTIYAYNMVVTLKAPDGTEYRMIRYPYNDGSMGTSTADADRCVIRDSGTYNVVASDIYIPAAQNYVGTFRPGGRSFKDVFRNKAANGTWELSFTYDSGDSDPVTLEAASLFFA